MNEQRWRVAVLDDYLGVALDSADWSAVRQFADIDVFREPVPRAEQADRWRDFDVLCVMRERTTFDAELIEQLPRLRMLASTSGRNAAIDVDAATRRGIVVCATRVNPHTTIELTWALMLALLRGVTANDAGLRSGGWQTQLGESVHGKTLGLIGLGTIGSAMARIAQGFGMDVIAWSQNLTDEAAEAAGARRVEKAQLFAQADVVSVHVRSSPRTHGVVGAQELALMRPSAVLVNTARAAIVDTAALVEALRTGRIRGAALDVYDTEPIPPDHPLLGLPNVLLSPHMGYVTRDSMELFYGDTVDNIVAFHAGTPLRVMNPDTLSR